MKILFAGGGTLGPVTPLLAVWRRMKKERPDLQAIWAGTPNGPEKELVEAEGITFFSVPVAKLTRYPSIKWMTWPLDFFRARRAVILLFERIKPSLIVSAGGFTSVPVIRVGRRRNIPCVIHQLDVEPGLSNIAVARMCQAVTTSFSYDKPPFRGVTSEQAATPCRYASAILPSKQESAPLFGLDPERPIMLIVGGGTGASALNEAMWGILDRVLPLTQVIHVTGKGKSRCLAPGCLAPKESEKGYIMKEFLDEKEMLSAYAAADVVISRAGMGGITDLIALKKPAILVPIPKSHQEANAKQLPFIVLEQGKDLGEKMLKTTGRLLRDPQERDQLAASIGSALSVDDGTALAGRWIAFLS